MKMMMMTLFFSGPAFSDLTFRLTEIPKNKIINKNEISSKTYGED